MNKHLSQQITEPQFSGLVRLFNLFTSFTSFTPFSLALLGFGFSLASSSLSAATLDDLEFTLINGDTEYSVSAVNRTTITGAVDIPATHNNLPVTEIGENGFSSSTITSVTIPSSLKVIQEVAFQFSTSLSTVTFAEGSQLTTIGGSAFLSCRNLINIDLPDSVSTLGTFAFFNCLKLVSITIPSGVTTLSNGLFSQCTALETVTFAEGSKLTTIGSATFNNCTSLINIDLPDSVSSLGTSAFDDCSSLVSITIPSGVTSLPDKIFDGCSDLASITLLGAAPTLGNNVFLNTGSAVGGFTLTIYDTHEASYASWGNSYTFNVVAEPADPSDPNGLQFTFINGDTEYSVSAGDRTTISGAVDIPAMHNNRPVTEIGGTGFYTSAITSVTIPNSIKVISGSAFDACASLSTVTFAEGSQLTIIDSYAFGSCINLVNIDIPDSVTTLGNDAFNNCRKLVSITIPAGVTELSVGLFRDCRALETVTFAEGSQLTTIAERAFHDCRLLVNIDIPDSVTTLGDLAFAGCVVLPSITIPAGVTSLPYGLFSFCLELRSITMLGAAPTLETEDVFYNAGAHYDTHYITVRGLVFTVYDIHEASYDSWRLYWPFIVVPVPSDSVHLFVETSYDPSTNILSLVSDNEPSDVAINLLHTNSLDEQWAALNPIDYAVSTDATTGTVTRDVTLDPETTPPSGFYRLSSENSEASESTE